MSRSAIIMVIVAGLLILVAGPCAGTMLAEGFGGPAPAVSEGRPYKIIAVACLVVGPVLAIAGAVSRYRCDRKK